MKILCFYLPLSWTHRIPFFAKAMLIVYVWDPVENLSSVRWDGGSSSIGLGHAALQTGGAYISVWPARAGIKEPFFASPDYKYDREERIRRNPEHTIVLHFLPELRVREMWKNYCTPFNELKANCCHVVGRALKISAEEYEERQRESESQSARFFRASVVGQEAIDPPLSNRIERYLYTEIGTGRLFKSSYSNLVTFLANLTIWSPQSVTQAAKELNRRTNPFAHFDE